ncbi:hypothetical protein BH10ACI3_BH10ACI3_29400 [soil metagenome]
MTGKKVTIILSAFGIFVIIAAISIAVPIYQSGFWHGPDAKFGDQHLKTAVALIELHKVRFNQYPKSLKELKYFGDWDGIAIQSVRYAVNNEQDKYCVEVTRGWIGKPELDMPDEFWQGTGYEADLCRK